MTDGAVTDNGGQWETVSSTSRDSQPDILTVDHDRFFPAMARRIL